MPIILYIKQKWASPKDLKQKRHHLETEFNEQLIEHEFLFKFRGDNEIILIGAPSGNIWSRVAISVVGVILVTFFLISGHFQGDNYNTTFVIGGCLLGLILTCTPFISFYSRKFYRILISQRIKQISVRSGVSSPDRRVDFPNIDRLLLKHLQIDDLISGKEDAPITFSYMHTLFVETQGKQKELFSLTSSDEEFKIFVEKLAFFLADFIDKELKIVNA